MRATKSARKLLRGSAFMRGGRTGEAGPTIRFLTSITGIAAAAMLVVPLSGVRALAACTGGPPGYTCSGTTTGVQNLSGATTDITIDSTFINSPAVNGTAIRVNSTAGSLAILCVVGYQILQFWFETLAQSGAFSPAIGASITPVLFSIFAGVVFART